MTAFLRSASVLLESDSCMAGPLQDLLAAQGIESERIAFGGVERALRNPALVVGAADAPRLDIFEERARVWRQRGKAYLPVWFEFSEVYAGPLFPAAGPGCMTCFSRRRLACHPQKIFYQKALKLACERQNPTATPAAARSAASLVAKALEGAIDGTAVAHEFRVIDLRSMVVRRHRYLPYATCGECGAALDELKAPATSPIHAECTSPGAWRARDLVDCAEALETDFVDGKAGIATTVGVDLTTSLCAVGSARFVMEASHQEEWTAGISDRFRRSKAIGIAEALERYAGLRPRRPVEVVQGNLQELGSAALNPRELILYSDEQYASPGFLCRRFEDDLPISWVWGWSFRAERAILVPEQAVYYDIHRYARSALFVRESSNGCATGASIDEALFYAVLETLERDAVLRVWHDRQRPRRIDLTDIRSAKLKLLRNRVEREAGYQVRAFDVSQEFGMPSVWVLLVNQHASGPRSFSASKAHPDPEIACLGALNELVGALAYNERWYNETEVEIRRSFLDPTAVADRIQHVLLGGLPEYYDEMGFMAPDQEPSRSLWSEDWREGLSWKGDMARAAQGVINRVIAAGYDVIAIDQTAPESLSHGFHTAKVLIPGLIPIAYGWNNHRLVDTPRIDLASSNLRLHPFA